MAEFIVHDLIEHNSMKRWLVFTNEDVLRNYEEVFGTQGINNLQKAISLYQANFYEIKRYFQFVGLLKYSHSTQMLTMSLFESESMDTFLEGFTELKIQEWKSADLNQIGVITQQIIDDPERTVAKIQLKKLL